MRKEESTSETGIAKAGEFGRRVLVSHFSLMSMGESGKPLKFPKYVSYIWKSGSGRVSDD